MNITSSNMFVVRLRMFLPPIPAKYFSKYFLHLYFFTQWQYITDKCTNIFEFWMNAIFCFHSNMFKYIILCEQVMKVPCLSIPFFKITKIYTYNCLFILAYLQLVIQMTKTRFVLYQKTCQKVRNCESIFYWLI